MAASLRIALRSRDMSPPTPRTARAWSYLARRKRWWLVPAVLVLAAIAIAWLGALGHAPDPVQYVVF